jgi:hypothetical protein
LSQLSGPLLHLCNMVFTKIVSIRRYARCWWHLTLHIRWKKHVSCLLFHFFSIICVCITWVWLGWGWDVLMYCSSFRNFTFCFYWFLFYIRLLVYIHCMCVVGVFLYGVCFNVCYVTVLYQFYFERICFSKMRLKVENYISRIF